jgi:phage tail-like protein
MSTKSSVQRNYPYANNRFKVEINGITQANFLEVIIPEVANEVIEHREGTQPTNSAVKQAGLVTCGNLILTWGMNGSMELYNWRKLVEQGKLSQAKRSIAVTVMDEEGNDVVRFTFSNAWPSKYKAPDLNAMGNGIAIETLEIVFDSMQRDK